MNIRISTAASTACDINNIEVDTPNIVNSHNEWDLLEEVVVGRIEGSVFPPRHPYVLGGTPKNLYNSLIFFGGLRRRPKK